MDMKELKNFIQEHLKTPTDYRYFEKRHPEKYKEILDRTDFLLLDLPLKARVYCLLNDLTSHPRCPVCGNPLGVSTNYPGFNMFCSKACLGKSDYKKEKTKQTCLEKYGVEHHLMDEGVKKKREKTNLKKYGVENVSQLKETKEKVARTQKERFGGYYTQSHLSPETIEKLSDEKWLREQHIENKKNLTEIAAELGVSNGSVIAYYMKKYGIEVQDYSLAEDVRERLNDREWLIHQHHDLKKSSAIIGDELGVSNVTVLNYLKSHDIECRQYGSSLGEEQIKKFIREHYDGVIHENNRSIIKPYELDILLPELKLAIEYCGIYWHSEEFVGKNYHKDKLERCIEKGYRLITIFEDEWIEKRGLVEKKILHALKKTSERVSARKTKVVSVSKEKRREFFEENHIQGDGEGSVNLGLEDDSGLVAVMTLKKESNGVYYLNRYATSKHVIGGFSKLLSYFKKNYEWSEIYTYADRRWSNGNLYEQAGFERLYDTKPNYFYFKNGFKKRHSRQKFMKSRLKRVLDVYDESLSEQENMRMNGYMIIYDCGNIKFSMKKKGA